MPGSDPMGFKDDVAADIEETFLNENELADLHTIDGVEMLASIDDYEAVKCGTIYKKFQATHETGTHIKRIILYVSMQDLKKLPVVNNIMIVDKKKYVVAGASNESGIAELTLEVRKI